MNKTTVEGLIEHLRTLPPKAFVMTPRTVTIETGIGCHEETVYEPWDSPEQMTRVSQDEDIVRIG